MSCELITRIEEIKRKRCRSVGDQNKETKNEIQQIQHWKCISHRWMRIRDAQVPSNSTHRQWDNYMLLNTILFEFIVLCPSKLYNLQMRQAFCVIQKVAEASASLVRRLMIFLGISLSSFQTFYERLISITSILLWRSVSVYCVMYIVPRTQELIASIFNFSETNQFVIECTA